MILSDILRTALECGTLNGKEEPGSTVAIVGAGPIGLAALLTAQFYSPGKFIMIDLDDNRLAVAKKFGATDTNNSTDGKALAAVMKPTGDAGVDTAIEAAGIPASLPLETLWDRNIAITTRLVDTATIPMLFKAVATKNIDPAQSNTSATACSQRVQPGDGANPSVILALFLPLLFLLAAAAFAKNTNLTIGQDRYEAGDAPVFDTPGVMDLFTAANQVGVAAPIAGPAYLAGRRVRLDAAIGGDLLAAGHSVDVSAPLGGNASITGYDISIGPVAGNLRAAGQRCRCPMRAAMLR